MLVNPVTLGEDFHLRKKVYIAFPLKVTDSTTRQAISCFQVNIDNVVKLIDHIYCCYS